MIKTMIKQRHTAMNDNQQIHIIKYVRSMYFTRKTPFPQNQTKLCKSSKINPIERDRPHLRNTNSTIF